MYRDFVCVRWQWVVLLIVSVLLFMPVLHTAESSSVSTADTPEQVVNIDPDSWIVASGMAYYSENCFFDTSDNVNRLVVRFI